LRFSKTKSCGHSDYDGNNEAKAKVTKKSSTMDHLSHAMRNLRTSDRARIKGGVKNRKSMHVMK